MRPAVGDSLPPQCSLVPVFPAESASPVRLCAVVQRPAAGAPATAAPQLVLLASSWLGRAHLGALTDAAGTIHAWLELWVQAAGAATALDDTEAGTNPELDARWRRWASLVAGDPATIVTGFETQPAPPVWLDVAAARAVVPRDAGSGEPYTLCTEDGALLVAGLESFSESRVRFLAVKGQPGAGFLAPHVLTAGAGADLPSGARAAGEALPGGGAGLVPFNPEGGSLLVRRLAPLEWEQHAGLLCGRTFRGLAAGRPAVKLGGPYAPLDDWDRLQQGGAHLFSTNRGRAGRFHESFHLKLLLFLGMVRAVAARVTATQLPQLDLGPQSFRVDLVPEPGALPVLWTARPVLVTPPAAVALTAPGELRYFKPAVAPTPSVYRPEGAGRALKGTGELRVRKLVDTGGRIQIEATLVSPELAAASPRDLVWARVPLPGAGVFDLVGNIDAAEALAGGEARFRTAPLDLGGGALAAVRAAEGGVFPQTPFRTLPLLSTPVDLYALGVLGVQLFLGGAAKPLPVAIDEVLSLARAGGAATPPAGKTASAGERVRAVAQQDPRWLPALGPHHHGHGITKPEEAGALMPLELWWDTLALLGRLFPGAGALAFCRDYGDAPAYQLDAVFAGPINELEALVLRSQSLLLCDWPTNREVARVIQRVR